MPKDGDMTSAALLRLLANSTVLLWKKRLFCWQFVDGQSQRLSRVLRRDYDELQEEIDLLAQEMTRLGRPVPSDLLQLTESASISAKLDVNDTTQAVDDIIAAKEHMLCDIQTLRVMLEPEDAGKIEGIVVALEERHVLTISILQDIRRTL